MSHNRNTAPMDDAGAAEPVTRDTTLPRAVLERVRHVLVIDDDEFVCNAIATQLRSLGAGEVRTSQGGAEAVRLLNEDGPFDLIVSDLTMPKFDGIQLMRLVAARQSTAALLYISASGRKLLSAAQQLAADRGLRVLPSLMKPVGLQQLREVLLGMEAGDIKARHRAETDSVTVPALRAAIDNYEIEVYVQPQLTAAGQLHGVEALARWNSPRHGFVPPDRFVALAEQHGFIGDLTELVLKKSLVACARWRQAGLETRISVNAPVAAMCDLMLPDTVLAQLGRLELQPDQLTLEITETGVLQDMERALDVLTRLRLRGIGLAIDDFGCGHSTFQQLRRLPFSELKIDCSFVMKMLVDRDAANIVRSCLDLSRDLELHAVAEGVESLAHWDALVQLGCPLLQGYHIAKPFPAAQLPLWMRQRRLKAAR